MPNVRRDGLVPVCFRCSKEFLGAIEEGRKQSRALDRSQFIRDAIAAKLAALPTTYKPGDELMPDRMGKGGRPKKVMYQIKPDAWSANEQPRGQK